MTEERNTEQGYTERDLDLDAILGVDVGTDEVDLDDVLNPPPPDPSPLEGVEYEGNLERDAKKEFESLKLKGFKERAKNEEKRQRLATDSEFWTCLVFQDREQKEAFLKALDLFQHGDKYLDGRLVARKLGVEIPESEISYRLGKIDPKLKDLT